MHTLSYSSWKRRESSCATWQLRRSSLCSERAGQGRNVSLCQRLHTHKKPGWGRKSECNYMLCIKTYLYRFSWISLFLTQGCSTSDDLPFHASAAFFVFQAHARFSSLVIGGKKSGFSCRNLAVLTRFSQVLTPIKETGFLIYMMSMKSGYSRKTAITRLHFCLNLCLFQFSLFGVWFFLKIEYSFFSVLCPHSLFSYSTSPFLCASLSVLSLLL